MDHEDEFLNAFFTQVAQLCSDKAKETVVSKDNKKVNKICDNKI